MPTLIVNGGPVIWLILIAAATAAVVFIERALFCHRSQINSAEFLNGIRTVLKRDNVVEAVSICDATPGPVARLVKAAILNRDKGRERVREAVEEAGLVEVPRLEEKLNLLATIAQIAPLLGLFGTIIGFIDVFAQIQQAGLYAHLELLAHGIWRALICAACGIGLAIPAHAGYNYLVSRVNKIILDMERAATEIVNVVKMLGGQSDAAPYATVFFLLVIFLLIAALLPTPGINLSLVNLPAADDLSGTDRPGIPVAIDCSNRLYFANQMVSVAQLKSGLSNAVRQATGPVDLIIQADKTVSYDQVLQLSLLARDVGITNALLATIPRTASVLPPP